MKIGWGIQQLIAAKSQYVWIESFLTGSAFVCFGVFLAVMLARRTNPEKDHAPKASDERAII
jgi:hypothetical protein